MSAAGAEPFEPRRGCIIFTLSDALDSTADVNNRHFLLGRVERVEGGDGLWSELWSQSSRVAAAVAVRFFQFVVPCRQQSERTVLGTDTPCCSRPRPPPARRAAAASKMSNSSANSTGGLSDGSTDLTVINILTYIFLCVVTFGIGSAVHLSSLREVWQQRKLCLLIGLLAQYLIMPAVARLIVVGVMGLPAMDAFGFILIGCCPGGAASNAFAYFAKADMALSVSMTATTNFLAFGTLPLFLFLWTHGLGATVASNTIPFLDIFGSLCMVLVPAALGVTLRVKQPTWAASAARCSLLPRYLSGCCRIGRRCKTPS
jgi:hypothetical protein